MTKNYLSLWILDDTEEIDDAGILSFKFTQWSRVLSVIVPLTELAEILGVAPNKNTIFIHIDVNYCCYSIRCQKTLDTRQRNIMEHTPVPPPRLKKSKSQIQLIMAEPPKTAAFIPPKQYNCLKAPDELELILKCYQFGPISAKEKTIVSSSETNYTDLLHQENLDNIKLLIQTDNNGNNKNRKHPSLRGHEDSKEIDSGVDFGDGFISRNNSATRVQNDIDRNKIIEEHEESYIRKTISYGQNPPSKYFIANSSESRNKSKPQGTIEEEEHTIDIKELVKGEGLEMYADTHISHSGGLCDANQIFQERDDLLLSTPKTCMRDSELLPNTEKLIQNLFMNDRNLDIHASSSNMLGSYESNSEDGAKKKSRPYTCEHFTIDNDLESKIPDAVWKSDLASCEDIPCPIISEFPDLTLELPILAEMNFHDTILKETLKCDDISVQEDQPVDYSQCEYLILEDDPHILPGEYCVSLIKNWGSLGLQIESDVFDVNISDLNEL
uniref:Uncharacterized protein n=1 Tax=Timema poppense TaxID=170557 RepID=A0A7R9H0I7_TIMPO|nr:unnamed protein product [Timema poppensis]